jgi:hypothetical protein
MSHFLGPIDRLDPEIVDVGQHSFDDAKHLSPFEPLTIDAGDPDVISNPAFRLSGIIFAAIDDLLAPLGEKHVGVGFDTSATGLASVLGRRLCDALPDQPLRSGVVLPEPRGRIKDLVDLLLRVFEIACGNHSDQPRDAIE